MRNFQGKRSFRRFLESWPVLAALGALTIFFTWQIVGFWSKMDDTRKNREIAENKVEELQEARAKLSRDIQSLQTEAGIEENIRNKFGLAKEGEEIIVVVEDQGREPEGAEEDGNFFSFWKKLFR